MRAGFGSSAAAVLLLAPALLKPGADTDDVFRANNRGAALMEQFKPQQALAEFERVTELAPGWAPGFVNLGLACLYARQMERAAGAFQQAIRLAPDQIEGHYGLAVLLKGQGRSEEAIAEFEAARTRDPKDPDMLYNIGLLQARQRRYPEAVAVLTRARQIDPNNMSIRYQLARALLQVGDTAKGQEEMAVYQRLAANDKIAQPTGNQYGEAGRYALVLTDYRAFSPEPGAGGGVAIRFSDATKESGVDFAHSGPGGDLDPASAARYGSGVAIGDLDGDGRPDLVFANASANGKAAAAVYHNRGGWKFDNATASAGVSFRGIGLGAALGDYDNDDDLDLALTRVGGVVLLQNQGGGRFKDVTAAARVSIGGFPAGASWGDIDHDGDLDLYVARLKSKGGAGGAGSILLLNRGDGTFEDRTSALHVAGPAQGAMGALFTDLDLDRDIDLVVSAAGGQDALLDNRREDGFEDTGVSSGLSAKGFGRGVTGGDVNGDGYVDLVFAAGADGANTLLLNGPGRPMARRELPRPQGVASCGSVLFDADNDGDLDLFLTGSTNLLLMNDGQGGFTDASASAGLTETPVKDGRGAGAADLDGDGDLDLVVSTNGGRPLLLRNEGGSRNRWLDVKPRGLNSNRQGIGAKVEVQSGPFWQRREVQAGSGYLSSSPAEAHFGLGSRGLADVVRLLWPGGVLQAEMDVPVGQRLEPQEVDRKGSSCPLLFAWNGGKYGFVTDILGVGGLGLWLAPGVYGKPDPEEYIKIEPDQLRPLDGGYYLQILENLEEITYLDQVRLMVIDHPKDIDVYPNENSGGETVAEHRMLAVPRAERIAPIRATDHRGRDVLDRLLKVDRTYPDDLRLHALAGYADMHHVTLEFPESVEKKEGLVLFLYGWVDFEYSSSNFAAHQSGLSQTLPVLEMEGEDGLFQPVLKSIGFPPGLPRMMTVDLGPHGPLASRRMRIRTNMRVYWDQAFLARPLDEAAFADKVVVSSAKLVAAHLHRRGFPREHSPDGRQPRLYDYGIMDNTQPFRVMTGDYTHFGRVTDLLTTADDRFVIFGKGEEVTLEFPVKGLPEPPKGSTRSFVLQATGYCKDMDPHTAHGDTVEPLPFRGMSSYPYAEGESYPDDALHRDYRREWNTRRLEGR